MLTACAPNQRGALQAFDVQPGQLSTRCVVVSGPPICMPLIQHRLEVLARRPRKTASAAVTRRGRKPRMTTGCDVSSEHYCLRTPQRLVRHIYRKRLARPTAADTSAHTQTKIRKGTLRYQQAWILTAAVLCSAQALKSIHCIRPDSYPYQYAKARSDSGSAKPILLTSTCDFDKDDNFMAEMLIPMR